MYIDHWKFQVAARRIIAGKWACNAGQACISVDYIITKREFAPTLVRLCLYNSRFPLQFRYNILDESSVLNR